ncbi:MAG: fimbrillin family protein [Prevotellaceae bacterium]|jgi:hypothetical protein|nr:fimbrillin family protein [Prevotellaceae bacterium]
MKRFVELYACLSSCLLLLLAACSNDAPSSLAGEEGNGVVHFQVGFAASTRVGVSANDFKCTWEANDAIGVYAVKRGKSNTKALSSTPANNYANNIRVVYNGTKWTADTPIHYPNDGDVLDIYAYYPYDAEATDPANISFAVLTDQSDTGLSKSMLMTAAKVTCSARTTPTVTLQLSHRMAMVQMNSRFILSESIAKKQQVATVLDLTTGTLTLDEEAAAKDITMHKADTKGTVWQMIVPVQTTGVFEYTTVAMPPYPYPEGTDYTDYDGEMTKTYTSTPTFTLAAGQTNVFRVIPGAIAVPDKETLMKIGDLNYTMLYPNTGQAVRYVQTADIDLAGIDWTPLAKMDGFGGEYEGNGYVINNLTIKTIKGSYNGLFSELRSATLSNITLVNVNIQIDDEHVGALAGQAMQSTLTNCRVIGGTIAGSRFVGGIIGYSSDNSFTACYVKDCTISATWDIAGGFIGTESTISPITECYYVGNVPTAPTNSGTFIGEPTYIDSEGFTTNIIQSQITDSYSNVAGDSQATTFSATAWPAWSPLISVNANAHWKSLGGWNAGTPVYPTLWYE